MSFLEFIVLRMNFTSPMLGGGEGSTRRPSGVSIGMVDVSLLQIDVKACYRFSARLARLSAGNGAWKSAWRHRLISLYHLAGSIL